MLDGKKEGKISSIHYNLVKFSRKGVTGYNFYRCGGYLKQMKMVTHSNAKMKSEIYGAQSNEKMN